MYAMLENRKVKVMSYGGWFSLPPNDLNCRMWYGELMIASCIIIVDKSMSTLGRPCSLLQLDGGV